MILIVYSPPRPILQSNALGLPTWINRVSEVSVYASRRKGEYEYSRKGIDLLSGSRDTNLYTISLDDMLKTSPICLLSKASKTNSWLWHRRLSHLIGIKRLLDDIKVTAAKLKFNSIKDAKLLLEAIEKRFGGNEASKKTQRNLLKQQYENFTAPSLEMLDQTFDRL
ncbi:hypothetical protein Tco_0716778 [Tanacetum coccineum]